MSSWILKRQKLIEDDEQASKELDLVITDDINLNAPVNDESRHFDIRDVLKQEQDRREFLTESLFL
jgi:hypothetical protein